MPRSLTFNTDALSPKSAFVNSLANPTPATPLEVTLTDSLTVNLFLISAIAGTYDTRSGDASYSLKVGVGNPGAVPSGGTFTLTFGANTTTALIYNSTAAQIQTALQALASTGAGNVLVTGAFPAYDVQFVGALANAAQALITANATLLTPNSAVDIGNEQIGGPTQNAIQSIEIAALPPVLQTTWTPITNGWSGTLNFDTAQLFELFGTSTAPLSLVLEVKLIDPTGKSVVVASPQITIYHRVIDESALGQGPFTNAASGQFAIANNSDNGTVTGLGLSVIPRLVFAMIQKPAGGLNLFASVVTGTITTDGFHFELNGLTDAATYKLNYILIF